MITPFPNRITQFSDVDESDKPRFGITFDFRHVLYEPWPAVWTRTAAPGPADKGRRVEPRGLEASLTKGK